MPKRSLEQQIGSVVIYFCIAITGVLLLYVTVAEVDLHRLLQSLHVLLSLAFQMQWVAGEKTVAFDEFANLFSACRHFYGIFLSDSKERFHARDQTNNNEHI